MSFINDALVKAQADKDNRYLHLENVLDAKTAGKPFRLKYPYIVLTVVLMIGLACLVYFMIWRPAEHPGRTKSVAPSNHTVSPASAKAAADISQVYMDALNHQRAGEYHIAEVLYQQVLSQDPDHVYALNNLGVLHMIQKKPDQAIVLFQRAAALKNDYVHPYYNLACIYAKQNKVEESLHHLQKAMAIKPDIGEWAMRDEDFKNLRDNASFRKIVEKKAH